MPSKFAQDVGGSHTGDEQDRNHLIASVASTLRLLELLSDSGEALSLANITRGSSCAKSSVHRMLATLVHLGYVEQDDAGRYLLTLKLARMGTRLLSSLDIVKASHSQLESLMCATNESAYLAILDASGQSVYVAKVETPRPVSVQAPLGFPTPAWCSTTGWVLLAFSETVQSAVLSQPLVPRVPGAVADPLSLRDAFKQVVRQGFAITRAQGNPDTGGIAAPIRDYAGIVVASCSVSVPLYRMDAALIRRCTPLVVQAATAISAELGFQCSHRRKRADAKP